MATGAGFVSIFGAHASDLYCLPNWRVAMRPGRRRQLQADGEAALREKEKASIRAKAEHPFFYMKRMFGYGKVRYRGLHKNAQRIALLLGFANLLIAELVARPTRTSGRRSRRRSCWRSTVWRCRGLAVGDGAG